MTIKYLDSKRISGLSLTYAYNVTTGGGQFNGMASNAPSGGVRARQGVKILSNFSGIGKKVQDITIGIRKNGTVSGTVNVQYINSSYTVLATASMNASELGTGTDDTYDFTLSSEVTIADGDRLLLQYSATAWSNGVVLNGASGTRPTGTDYTYEGTLNSNSFTDGSGSGVPMMTFGGADIKPTNVQDNSIFVETDTARRYWFDAESDNTIAFEDDFSSDTWTGCKINACDNGAPTTVTISGGDLSAVNVNVASDDRMRKALGLTLSNTAWIYQFEANVSSTGTHSTLIGLVTSGGNMNNTSILCDYNGSNKIIMREYNSGLTEMGSGISISTGTQYYVTVIRTSLTGLTLEVRTGSHTGTLVGSESGTITGATGLTYVQSGAYGRGSGTASYDIDNIKIYNGVTSTTTPATWTREIPSFTASFWAAGGTASPWTPVNYHDEFNGSTWSSATALGTSVEMVTGCGTQSAGLIMGGDTSGTVNPTTTVQEWNGSAWSTSTGGTLNVARGANAGGGINTDAWVACGNDGSTESTTSSFWDDSSWTSGAALSTARRNVAGGGSTTDCWVTGGYTGSATVASTEQYNGTSWSAGGNISAATDGLQGGSGDTYNAIFTGGTAPSASNRSNIYNGTAWSLGGTLSNTHRYGITSGTPQDAISGMGYISSWTPTWAELYNGTTWSTTGSVGSGRATGGSGN
jgi:hypothetical protein